MRWAEILKEVRFNSIRINGKHQIFVTNAFTKNFTAFKSMDNKLEGHFNEFLIKKMNGEILSKDSQFASNSPLKGVWHYHIRFGDVVITYTIDNTHMEIYTIDVHAAYEGVRQQQKLGDYIKKLSKDDFGVYLIPDNKINFTKEQMIEIEGMIYSLVGDRSLVEFLETGQGILKDIIYGTLGMCGDADIEEFFKVWEKQYKISFDKFVKRLMAVNNN